LVEGLIFLIAQMFGIVLWAWNRIQSRLRDLVTCDGLRKGGPESPTDSDQPHPALEGAKEVEDSLLIRRREPHEIRYDRIGFRRRISRRFR
jgi:hypothetical protein